jgi:predicted ribosomally synthesized peptide with nif11-like leader
MKTVEDFIHRLHHDPEFEQRAHSYEDSNAFMDFVKGEGYDFTLDQLLDIFKEEEAAEPAEMASPPTEPVEVAEPPAKLGVEAFIQRLQQDPEFERQAQSFDNNDAFMEFVRKEGYDFTLDELTAGFKQHKDAVKPEAQQEQPLPPAKLETLPAPRPAVVAESPKPPESAVADSETKERPVRLTPRFEGFIGGRRRGMRWSDSEV